MKKKTKGLMISAVLAATSVILPHAPKIIPEGNSLIAAAAVAATLSIPAESAAAIMPARIAQLAVTVPQSCEAGVMEQLCSSVTSFLNDEAARADTALKNCAKNCNWKKRKDELIDAARKKAKESCARGEAPDINDINEGLDGNAKDKLKKLYDSNSRMFDGSAKLASKDFDVKSNESPALTGKSGQITDLKSAEPAIPKLSHATEFSLSGTKLSGETSNPAATKQSPILLAFAASAKTSADTASAASSISPADATTSAKSVASMTAKANAADIDPGYDCEGTLQAWAITNPEYAATCSCSNGPHAPPVCGCSAGKVTIVGPKDLILSKPYTDSTKKWFRITFTGKSPSKIQWSVSNTKVKFASGTNKLTAQVFPVAESQKAGDVIITAAVDNCSPVPQPLTVRRPKFLSHLQPLPFKLVDSWAKFAGLGTDNFWWTLTDQLGERMPNIPGREEVSLLGSEIGLLWRPWPFNVLKKDYKTLSDGTVSDHYWILVFVPFNRSKFQSFFTQKQIINGYTGFSAIKITFTNVTGTSPVELR